MFMDDDFDLPGTDDCTLPKYILESAKAYVEKTTCEQRAMHEWNLADFFNEEDGHDTVRNAINVYENLQDLATTHDIDMDLVPGVIDYLHCMWYMDPERELTPKQREERKQREAAALAAHFREMQLDEEDSEERPLDEEE